MYADRANGAGNVRKQSVKERLGGDIQHLSFNRQQTTGKRTQADVGKWRHDLFEDDNNDISKGRISTRDLRFKLARQNPEEEVLRSAGNGRRLFSGMTDLREKLSGSVVPQVAPLSQLGHAAEKQQHRELTPMVPTSTSVAQVRILAPPAAAAAAARSAVVPKTTTTAVGQKATVAALLQSLGLGKYLITFQAEEVDMAVLRHMSDHDLKELGVPMGPRKKILLALGAPS